MMLFQDNRTPVGETSVALWPGRGPNGVTGVMHSEEVGDAVATAVGVAVGGVACVFVGVPVTTDVEVGVGVFAPG